MPLLLLLATVPLMLLRATPGAAAPQTSGQQACVAAVGQAGVDVARAQAALNTACLDTPGSGLAACVANDDAPALAAARGATFDAAVASCAEPPDFGLSATVDEGVSTAAVAHVRGLVRDALGSSPDGALIDPAEDRRGRRCQASIVTRAGAIVTRSLSVVARCVRKSLARGREAGELLPCVASARKAVAKARKQLTTAARRKCRRVDVTAAFPGACGTAGSTTAVGRCLGERTLCRACRAANAVHGLDADCDAMDDDLDNGSCTFPVTLRGDAIPFVGSPGGRIAGADVSLLELPDRHVTTGADGHFVFDGLEEGSDVTLVLSHPDYHAIQTGTFRLGPGGIDRVTFQAVTYAVYDALAALLAVTPDEENRCQMVTTVTRVGRSIYDPGAHGEDGVTVTLDPPLPAEHGPIYFNSSVLPDRSLTETSDDGGVLFIQVPPGEYVWTAHKAGAVFSRVKMKCRVGLLVNASPPRGLQRR